MVPKWLHKQLYLALGPADYWMYKETKTKQLQKRCLEISESEHRKCWKRWKRRVPENLEYGINIGQKAWDGNLGTFNSIKGISTIESYFLFSIEGIPLTPFRFPPLHQPTPAWGPKLMKMKTVRILGKWNLKLLVQYEAE